MDFSLSEGGEKEIMGLERKLELKIHFAAIIGHSYDHTIPLEEFIDMDYASELM